MRVLLAILGAAALAWTGWWFLIASRKEDALRQWLAERAAAGWVAEAEAIEVAGFPYRVDTTVRGLMLANPDAGWAWSTPEVQFLTLAYQPQHLIVIWPAEQTLATPLGSTTLRAATLRASVKVDPLRDLALETAIVEIADLVLIGAEDWQIGLDAAQVALRRSTAPGAEPFTHDFALSGNGLALPGGIPAGFDPVVQTLALEGTARLDRAIDRTAVETDLPRVRALDLADATFAWGALDLRGKGQLVADEQGRAEGSFDLRARNWRAMLEAAERSGAISGGTAGALRAGLGLMAGLGGNPDSLEATLDLRGGRVFLGPVPIGPAPRL